MKSYIDFNTQKRKEATNEADKNQFKLLNNAVYGRTRENMRKRIKAKIIKNEKNLKKHTARSGYINYGYYGKRLIVMHEKKEQLTLNKPIYVGNTVLELSKLAMYKFHYDFMKNEVNIFTLLYTDTDNSIYEIIGEDFYEIMHKHKELFDLSNQPKDSHYFCNDNKKAPGKIKDEYAGIPIYEFIGLKSKMFSIRDITKKVKSTYKDHSSDIKYDQVKDTHSNKKVLRHNMRGIKSQHHEICTYESNKTSLSGFDDKRYILDDGINTLPKITKKVYKNIIKSINV